MESTRTLEQAIRAGYVVIKSSYAVSSKYWKWCAANQRAYVCIKPRRKYATVEMDLLDVDFRLNTAGIQAAWQVIDYATPADVKQWWRCSASGTWTQSRKVPFENAHTLAQALAWIGNNPDFQMPAARFVRDYDLIAEAEEIANAAFLAKEGQHHD